MHDKWIQISIWDKTGYTITNTPSSTGGSLTLICLRSAYLPNIGPEIDTNPCKQDVSASTCLLTVRCGRVTHGRAVRRAVRANALLAERQPCRKLLNGRVMRP
jgi:hypothetical protein